MTTRRPHASGSHLRLGRGRLGPALAPAAPAARGGRGRADHGPAPLPAGVVGLVAHPTHRPFAATAAEAGPDEWTVLLLVRGDALAVHEVRDGDQVVVRVGRAPAYGDLVVVGGLALEVDGLWTGPDAPAHGPEVVTLAPSDLTLWKYRPEGPRVLLRTRYRTACLPSSTGGGVLGVVIAVLRRPG